jgi:hypothetical protein
MGRRLEAGLGTGWVPREMRHTFVSLLSARGVEQTHHSSFGEMIFDLTIGTSRGSAGRSGQTSSEQDLRGVLDH